MPEPSLPPLRALFSSRKTVLGAVAIVGTQAVVAFGIWRGISVALIVVQVAPLVTTLTAMIVALGQEDAAKAMPPPSMTPEHVAAMTETVTAAATTAAAKAVSASMLPAAIPLAVTMPAPGASLATALASPQPSTTPSGLMSAVRLPPSPSVPDFGETDVSLASLAPPAEAPTPRAPPVAPPALPPLPAPSRVSPPGAPPGTSIPRR